MATRRRRKIDLEKVRSNLYSIAIGDDDRLAVAAARVLLQDAQSAEITVKTEPQLLNEINAALQK